MRGGCSLQCYLQRNLSHTAAGRRAVVVPHPPRTRAKPSYERRRSVRPTSEEPRRGYGQWYEPTVQSSSPFMGTGAAAGGSTISSLSTREGGKRRRAARGRPPPSARGRHLLRKTRQGPARAPSTEEGGETAEARRRARSAGIRAITMASPKSWRSGLKPEQLGSEQPPHPRPAGQPAAAQRHLRLDTDKSAKGQPAP